MRRMLCATAVVAPVLATGWLLTHLDGRNAPANRSAQHADEGRSRDLPPDGQSLGARANVPVDHALTPGEFRELMPGLSESLFPSSRGLRRPAEALTFE